MLQEQVKSRTKHQHDMLEKLMYVDEIMSKTLSKDQYSEILIINFLVHSAFEDAVISGLADEARIRLDIKARRKLPALKRDIEELGLEVDVVGNKFKDILNSEVPVFDDASAIGALYVLEGATMGGNVIQKKLKLNSNFSGSNLSFNYYTI